MADQVESEKIEVKLLHKLSLSFTPSFHDSLLWSCDDRISVVMDQCVFIITLLFSEESNKSSLKYHLSCIQAHEEAFTIETGNINKQDVDRNLTIKQLLDTAGNPSKTSGINYTSFISAAWSPSGCDSYQRCIIATLCLDHRLSLYTSNKIDKNWNEICCISDKWHKNCKTCSSKFKKKAKKNDCPAISAKSKLELDYINTVAFIAIDWCPVLLDISTKDSTGIATNCQKYALLAAVTKSGKVTFWRVAVPLSDSTADVQLVQSDIETIVQLPCSIAWYSIDGREGLLGVGGSNGQIEVFVITVSEDSESSITINSTSKHMLWKDCDDLAVNRLCWTYNSKDQNSFTTLSASKGSVVLQFSVPLQKEDNLQESKHHIYDGLHSAFITGLDASQNGRVVSCDSDSVFQLIEDKCSKVISHESIPSYCCNGIAVSPNGLYILLLHSPSITSLQVDKRKNKQTEVSILSLFSEEFLSNVITQSSLGTSWDVQTAICQHYSQNDPPKKGPVVEFTNRPLDSIPFSSLYLRRRLVDQFSRNSDSEGLTSEDVEAESNFPRDWRLESTETGRQIVKRYLTSSLELWLQNYKKYKPTEKALTSLLVMSDWLVTNYNDQDTLDRAERVYDAAGDTKSAAIASSIRENRLRARDDVIVLSAPLKQESVEKQDPDVMDLTQNGSMLQSNENKLPCREKCKVCQADIPLNSLISGQCANGHAWKRCLATFCICAEYLYHRCQDCGGCTSLIGQEQSPWLQKLLRETQFCTLCHGRKDPRV